MRKNWTSVGFIELQALAKKIGIRIAIFKQDKTYEKQPWSIKKRNDQDRPKFVEFVAIIAGERSEMGFGQAL